MMATQAKYFLFIFLLTAEMSTATAATINVPDDQLTIQAAIDAASDGDTIIVAAGDYAGFTLNKAVTIQGPNAGTAGAAGTRGAEARIINATISITADGALIDGIEVFRDNADATRGILLQAAATIRNSVFRRDTATTGTVVRGIEVAVGTSGFTVENNLFTGNPDGGLFGGHRTWNNCIYSNISPDNITASISNNTFDVCRTALNFDGFSPNLAVNNNTFLRNGTHIAFGGTAGGNPPPPAGSYTLTGNNFGIDFANPITSLPSAIINNSNVEDTFSLDLIGNNFGGVATGALTTEQKGAIEARMYHRGRSGREGVANFAAGEQVVVAGLTTVASAIEAATPGDNITIFSTDPYDETITTDGGATCANPFTLSNEGGGAITLTFDASITTPFLLLAPGSTITVVPDTLLCAAVTPPASVGGFAEPLFPAAP